MDIKQTAVAGSLESSDIMVTVNPSDVQGITVQLESSVEKQFGQQIRKVIEETLKHLGVKAASVEAVDKGALDCTIKARTIAAVHRAAQVEVYDWKEIDSWNA
ncbi:citrate lyase acyl carrier protein [Streptococcus mutans]|uniref:citrate lyase acyl carrier protein n=1 Tax=Streptococcus mutans TaxID=1309 RepID=UPI00066C99B3|nr:citrate lyase acyl carrier protein [Streptococcus mutans]MCY7115952.1 citrate lyase acyl carrier protein [Streptococcus mutans]